MENKVRIQIKTEDLDYKTSYKIDNVINLYPDLGWEATFQGEFASLINKFMGIAGYGGYDKDCIFLESVTLEEYDYLLGKLDEYRSKNNE